MPDLCSYADIIIGNEEDASLCLGIDSGQIDVEKGFLPIDGYKNIAKKIFSKFKKTKILAFTLRESVNASINKWSAVLFTKDQIFKSSKYTLDPVIDRVGAGDSFAAGLIWGLNNYKTIFKKL